MSEKRNQFVLWVSLLAVGCVVEIARTQDADVFEYLSDAVSDEVREEIQTLLDGPQATGVNDPSLSNTEINEKIAELIFSGDSDKVDEGISQLSMFVEFVNWHSRARERPPVLRDFAAIPGLKEFLLWYWRKNVQESGGTPPRFTPPVEVGPKEELQILQDVEKFKDWLESDKPPPWTEIPYVLAVVFPRDEEVHEVIWENYDPSQPGGTLNALTLGRFATPEATALRIDALLADPNDFLANSSGSAARGLGQCQTDEGFSALVERMEQLDDIHLASFVVEAIVSYGSKALTHKDKLTQIGKRFHTTAETEFEPANQGSFPDHGATDSRHRLHSALKNLNRLSQFDDHRKSTKDATIESPHADEEAQEAINRAPETSSDATNVQNTSASAESLLIFQIEWDSQPSHREMYFKLVTDADGNFSGEWTNSDKKTFQVENLEIQENTFYFSFQPHFDDKKYVQEYKGTFNEENISGEMFERSGDIQAPGAWSFSGHRKPDQPPPPVAVEIEPFAPLAWNDGLYTVLTKSNEWTDVQKRFIECKGAEEQETELRMNFDAVANDEEFTIFLDNFVETTMNIQGEQALSADSAAETVPLECTKLEITLYPVRIMRTHFRVRIWMDQLPSLFDTAPERVAKSTKYNRTFPYVMSKVMLDTSSLHVQYTKNKIYRPYWDRYHGNTMLNANEEEVFITRDDLYGDINGSTFHHPVHVTFVDQNSTRLMMKYGYNDEQYALPETLVLDTEVQTSYTLELEFKRGNTE
ncbi:MAG: hypothetical protein F4X56_01045 [Gammaproteobacteria bacterium]|nr:hypothetical protein [Gammaproteobacteria bacterium]